MNVQLIYQHNASAEKIYSYLNNRYDHLSLDEIIIGGHKHLLMKITDPSSNSRRSINTYKAVNNCLDTESAAEMLQANRIGYFGGDEGVLRSYEVLIADLNILSIKLVYHGRSNYKPKYLKESDHPKLSELAKRIYLILGLDIGMVRLAYTTRRRLKVVEINPSPLMRKKDLNIILGKIDETFLMDTILPGQNVKLGADPEFMLFNSKNNRLLSASQFFPRDGIVGCDNIRLPNRQQRPIAEIRPYPSSCPLKLSNNIKHALETANRLAPYQNVKWLAGSQPGGSFSIGGHIHFSNIQLNAGIIRALDNYMAIPIFLLEEPTAATRRRRRYGFLGDFRVKEYGGFEYRTPASWLVSQEITTAILCLAKIIASSYYILTKNYLNSVDAQAAFYSGDQDYFRPIFPDLWADIENTNLYPEYQEQMQILLAMISGQTIWNEKSDFRKAWKLKTPARRYLRNSSAARSSAGVVRSVSPPPARVAPSHSTRVRGSSSQVRTVTSTQGRRTHIYR